MTNTYNNTNDTDYTVAMMKQSEKAVELAKRNAKWEMIERFGLLFIQDHLQQTIFDSYEYNALYAEGVDTLTDKINDFMQELPKDKKYEFVDILLSLNVPMSILLAEAFKAGVKDSKIYHEMIDDLEYLANTPCEKVDVFAGLPHDAAI